MMIVVRYLSILESAANTSKDEYTLSEGSTTQGLMAAISERHGHSMKAWIRGDNRGVAALAVVHGRILRDDDVLQDGDVVAVFLPTSGG